MSFVEVLRQSALVATDLWKAHVRAKRLPPWTEEAIGPGYLDALYAGTMVQQLTEDREAILYMLGMESRQSMRWASAGFPQFALTASAAAAFVLTDTAGVRWDDLRLPFGDFMIVLPTPSPIVFDCFNGREQEVRCIQVGQCTMPVQAPQEHVDAVFKRAEEGWRMGLPLPELRRILGGFSEGPAVWVQGVAASTEAIQRTYRINDPTQTLASWCDPENMVGEWQSERSRHAMSLVCRVVACLALYLDHSQGPEKRWDPSLLEANRAKGKPTTWDIGRELKLPKDLRESARMLGRADKDPAKWSVQSRLLVRGHWRNQAHGQGRAERRKQWIQPYWRGDEAGAVVQRLYKIGEE